ncbi:MAG: hypothetical protein DRJ56_05730 [Thermoprotei archaeon]|nr:MAG: hypothetical protein DRJ56_05730 [Thermoprotei archaeon]
MPDAFAHCLVGVVAGRCANGGWRLYLLAVALSTLPDLDGLTPLHRSLLHSLLLLTPISLAAFLALRRSYPTKSASLIACLPLLHCLMDLLTGGPPVKLFYPISSAGFQLAHAVDALVGALFSISPYAYYLEATRVDLVLLAITLAMVALSNAASGSGHKRLTAQRRGGSPAPQGP